MFYKLKLKDNAKGDDKSVFGVTVYKDKSVYVETERDLIAEAEKRRLTTVTVQPIDTVPERGEDGNAAIFIDFKDEGLSHPTAENVTETE